MDIQYCHEDFVEVFVSHGFFVTKSKALFQLIFISRNVKVFIRPIVYCDSLCELLEL